MKTKYIFLYCLLFICNAVTAQKVITGAEQMAAIAAYPYLSCKGEQWTPRMVWGVEDIVMCPGKNNNE